MLITALTYAAAAAAGFGLGRIKNASKLAAIKASIAKAEADAKADVKTVIADIKSKL